MSAKVICSWCGKVMAEGTEPATHGICPECLKVELAKLDKEEKGE